MAEASQHTEPPPVGLIAGAGRLPFMVAEGVKRAGRKLAVVGLRGSVDMGLQTLADRFSVVGVTRLGEMGRTLRRWGVARAVMVGVVRKEQMFSPLRLLEYFPDPKTAYFFFVKMRKDKRDNKLLTGVADELAADGVELINSVSFCTEHLAHEGVMTRIKPGDEARKDARFGWDIACRSADLDIGQSLAVKERDIIAVEALEGTDRMIRRAGELCKMGGWTMVKVARADQDMRFDVPTVGPGTIELLKATGGGCLVVEAERTIIVDKPQTLALADRLRIPVLGMARGESAKFSDAGRADGRP
jgi:hypothetical protein